MDKEKKNLIATIFQQNNKFSTYVIINVNLAFKNGHKFCSPYPHLFKCNLNNNACNKYTLKYFLFRQKQMTYHFSLS